MSPRATIPLFACALLAACGGDELERAETGCDGGDAAACARLGRLRLSGAAGPKDKRGGREAFERACDLGDGAGCGMAGSLVYARRDHEARRWLRRGCELDHHRSCTTLAWMLLHGEGGDADPAGARATFDRGCRGGEAAACVFAALTIPDEGGLDESAAAEARAGRLERACALGDDQACERRRDR